MIHRLPCLYGYISTTKKGNRNENLFKAINHLRHYNQESTLDNIIKEALLINNSFHDPLSNHEVEVICKHVLARQYHTSCWKFKKYCQHCRYGKFRRLWRHSKPGYWKHINEHNRLIGIKVIADDMYYPWDIMDTSKLNDEDKGVIQRFREEMSIPIAIDTIVKSYGIPVGDKAKREWQRFRESDGS